MYIYRSKQVISLFYVTLSREENGLLLVQLELKVPPPV